MAKRKKPEPTTPRPWRSWFDERDNYLGERSARKGPDHLELPSKQPCQCEQCKPESES